MDSDRLGALIELGDSDEMLREINRLCADEEWEQLLSLRQRCHLASVERGKPLWGAAAHAEYRLALEAPGEFVAEVLGANTGPFALGPLPEVAASGHEWDELQAVFVPTDPDWATLAYECVARGDDLGLSEAVRAQVEAHNEVPIVLSPWEPEYAVAEYESDHAEFARPFLQVIGEVELAAPQAAEFYEDEDALAALQDVTRLWQTQSNAKVLVNAVEGEAVDAIRSIGVTPAKVVEIDGASAVNLIAWAAATGGVQGPRAGMAVGRAKAWFTIAALGAATEDWPLASDEVEELLTSLRFFTWDTDDTTEGWCIALAVSDPEEEVSFVLYAEDQSTEPTARNVKVVSA